MTISSTHVILAAASIIVVILGWYVAHYLTRKRDQANKRRDPRIQYLIEAYRNLEFASNRPLTADLAPYLEKAVADIQLFGTPEQVYLAQDFAVGFAKKGSHSLDRSVDDGTSAGFAEGIGH
jgi:hypothetical protein